MSRIAVALVAIAACVVVGCGSGVGQGTTLEEARDHCDLRWPVSDDIWDVLVIMFESLHDDPVGPSKTEALQEAMRTCAEYPLAERDDCLVCLTKVIDAIW